MKGTQGLYNFANEHHTYHKIQKNKKYKTYTIGRVYATANNNNSTK